MGQALLAEDGPKKVMLYVLAVFYLLSLIVVAKFARRRKAQAMAKGEELQAHFGGSFGAPLLILTTFSTVYSGFTVTGIPDEANRRGFVSLRWVGATIVIAASMMLLYPRLRHLALERGYSSPNDFVADRFGTRRTRLATAVCGFVPMVIYITAQMISFAAMVQGFTSEDLPRWAPMLVLIVALLVFEHLGGMNSVVLTDAVQSCIMIASFAIVPFALGAAFGFLPSVAPASCSSLEYVQTSSGDPFEAPATCPSNSVAVVPDGCVASGCTQAVRPEFYTYPNGVDQADIAFFLLNMCAAPLQPHMIQRSFIAASDSALRLTMAAMLVAPFLAQTPGILIGLTKATFGPSWPAIEEEATAFSSVSGELAGEGWGQYLLVSVMTCATMAAIMSTADSALMGASSLAVDVYSGLFRPQASQRHLVHIGGLVSIATCFFAFGMAMFLTNNQLGEIILFQNGMLMQLLPAFGLGLYAPVAEPAVLAGLCSGLVVLVALVAFGNPLDPYVPLVNVSVVANFAAVALVHLLLFLQGRRRLAAAGADGASEGAAEVGGAEGAAEVGGAEGVGGEAMDERLSPKGATSSAMPSGEAAAEDGALPPKGRLSHASIGSVAVRVGEPSKPLVALLLLVIFFSIPWYRSAGAEEPIIWGLPRWGFIQMWLFALAALLGLAAAFQWRLRDSKACEEAEVVKARRAVNDRE